MYHDLVKCGFKSDSAKYCSDNIAGWFEDNHDLQKHGLIQILALPHEKLFIAKQLTIDPILCIIKRTKLLICFNKLLDCMGLWPYNIPDFMNDDYVKHITKLREIDSDLNDHDGPDGAFYHYIVWHIKEDYCVGVIQKAWRKSRK